MPKIMKESTHRVFDSYAEPHSKFEREMSVEMKTKPHALELVSIVNINSTPGNAPCSGFANVTGKHIRKKV